MTQAKPSPPSGTSDHMRVLGSQLATLEAAEVEAQRVYRDEQANRRGTGLSDALEMARERLFDIQDRIAAKRLSLAQIEDAEAQTAAARAAAESAATKEDASFWLRRFILSLSIANGTGFVGLAAGVLQSEGLNLLAAPVTPVLWLFALGLVTSGVMPGAMWVLISWRAAASWSIRGVTGVLVVVSAACFLVGLYLSIQIPGRLAAELAKATLEAPRSQPAPQPAGPVFSRQKPR